MKKAILIFSLVYNFCNARAQAPEDVLRYSYFPSQGTARNTAIGGAMGSLGGDLSALYVNPAGLAFFKTREIVLTPGFNFNSNKASYRGDESSVSKSAFNFGTTGIVIGSPIARSGSWQSQAFSIGITQTANFNNTYYYKGLNDFSSGSEQYAEEIAHSGQDISYFQQKNTTAAFGTALAYNTYLVDLFGPAGNQVVKGLPELVLEKGIPLAQEKSIKTSGGIYELALGYAASHNDNLYLGGSIGVPLISYTRNTFYRENDPSGNVDSFSFYELNDKLTTTGVGVNAKLGLIFKANEFLRFGLAVHTPTFASLTDKEYTSITTNTEKYATGDRTATSSQFLTDAPNLKYAAVTPWKAMVSASYVFRSISDTRLQRGFVTADVEYVGYSNGSFKADGDYYDADAEAYYDDLKTVIKANYKGAFNFRLGGELKFNTLAFRLGGAYYSNPNKDAALKSNFIQAGGGIGYRNHGVFVDLTFVEYFNKDVNFPYRLTDKANTFATQKNNRGNVLLTVGFKI